MALSIPACLLAAYAPSDTVLFGARVLGGLSAGMAYPTTLALIAARGPPARTRSIALWSAIGGAIASSDRWRPASCSVLLVGIGLPDHAPPALLAPADGAFKLVPAHVNETTDPVDNLGGILSVVLVAALILGHFAPIPNETTLVLSLFAIALAAAIAIRQRKAATSVRPAGRRPSRVLGRCLRRHHRLRNADGRGVHRSAVPPEHPRVLHAGLGASILPAAACMVVVAPRSAKLVESRGARITLLAGYLFCLLGFLTMLFLWKEGSSYLEVGLAYAFIGIGVGFAGTPASHSLTGSVPVDRAGMASGTADLQRDLGGALMTSILGALLAAVPRRWPRRSGRAWKRPRSPTRRRASSRCRSGAESVAEQYPKYADRITAAAEKRSTGTSGPTWRASSRS